MFELPTPIVLIVIGFVAFALYLFFWRAVRDLSLPMKIAARVLLTVVLILPLALVALSTHENEMFDQIGSSLPGGQPHYSSEKDDAEIADGAPAKPEEARRDAVKKSKPRYYRKRPTVGGGADTSGGFAGSPPAKVTAAETPSPAEMEPPVAMAPETTAPAASPQPVPPPSEPTEPYVPTGAGTPPAAANGGSEHKTDWTLVPVFYGTDRNQKPTAERVKYDWKRGRRLELGRAMVTIPKTHVIPMVERPWALKIPYVDITLYEAKEDPARHFTIHEMKALTQEEFLALVRAKIATASRYKNHALVFVHGYKTKFDNAVFRTAQIAYDLKFDAAPFLYSWPSGGTLQGYTYDRESAAQAEPYLKNFLELVVNETGAKTVSVIAHSMGNQPLLRVLQDLKRAKPDDVIISQLILAAPDVDRDNFENIVKTIKGIAKGVTLYTAANDSALQVSRRINGGVARAGDVPETGPIVVEGIDTIDATATSMDSIGINHSGYAENNALLADIGMLIRTGKRPPDERVPSLERVPTDSGTYWRYPQPAP